MYVYVKESFSVNSSMIQYSVRYLRHVLHCPIFTPLENASDFSMRRVIARACAHAHLEMSRRAKNCPPNKQQIPHLECFYFLQA